MVSETWEIFVEVKLPRDATLTMEQVSSVRHIHGRTYVGLHLTGIEVRAFWRARFDGSQNPFLCRVYVGIP